MLINDQETRLDPRVKRTRKLLQKSFGELLMEKGFQSITVADITERAEVNRATFYLHFEDKYALLNHMVWDAFHDLLVSKLPGEPLVPTISRLMPGTIVCLQACGLQYHEHCRPGFPAHLERC